MSTKLARSSMVYRARGVVVGGEGGLMQVQTGLLTCFSLVGVGYDVTRYYRERRRERVAI